MEVNRAHIAAIVNELEEVRHKQDALLVELKALIEDDPLTSCQRSQEIIQLGFSVRLYHVLTGKYNSFRDCSYGPLHTVADIVGFPKYEWHLIKGFGKAMAREIEQKMHDIGYADFSIPMRGYCPQSPQSPT